MMKEKVHSPQSRVQRQKTKKDFFSSIIHHPSCIVICILFSVFCSLFSVSFAQSISSVELINNAKQYDNKTVTYQGESIGEVMRRGGFAWINLNDGVNAIGIWLNKDLAGDISYLGSYKSIGDIVQVEGVFHRSCLEHGGDLDIHAVSLKKIKNGKVVSEEINIPKRNFLFLVSGVLCLTLILSYLKHKSNRK